MFLCFQFKLPNCYVVFILFSIGIRALNSRGTNIVIKRQLFCFEDLVVTGPVCLLQELLLFMFPAEDNYLLEIVVSFLFVSNF